MRRLAIVACCVWPALGAPGDLVPLLNPGFESAGDGAVDGYAATGFQPYGGPNAAGLPGHWKTYQWGGANSRYLVGCERGAGRDGSVGLRAQNLDAAAKAGIYQHPKLAAATYRLSVWARTEPGQTARIALYLASAYSRPLPVTETWTRLSFENTLSEPLERAELNIQNASGQASTIWLDEVTLEECATVRYELVPDTRPAAERPRTLLFSPMNIQYLRETAPQWASSGFRGFLFDGVMASWESDVWAADGNAATRGEDDPLLAELRACNQACREVGIDSNFVKVAFYKHLPDWFDDAAWATVVSNFREGAKFARLGGCAGLAIDTEYVSEQYAASWAGYQDKPRPLAELKAKVRERLRAVTAAMLAEWPEMVLLTLPEGVLYYGELYGDLLAGMVDACAAADAPGGLHVMTEGTYHNVDPASLDRVASETTAAVGDLLSGEALAWWRRRGTVTLGAWPLGWYRSINDENGKHLGYSGKAATFGDKIVGSYADKSEWYTPDVFARQMAGLNSFSPRYNWIYGHGSVFWQWSEAELERYRAGAHKTTGNATLPTVPNLADYLAVIARPGLAVRR